MSKSDWVPAYGYGDIQNLNSGVTTNLPLMDPTRYGFTSTYTEGVIEDDSGRYFVERIVGQYTLYHTDNQSTTVPYFIERIWPGLYQDDSTVETPGFVTTTGGANARFWYDKTSFSFAGQAWEDQDLLGSPWWRSVDIRPRQVCEQNIGPIWSVFNADPTVSARLIHRLRLLLRPLRE